MKKKTISLMLALLLAIQLLPAAPTLASPIGISNLTQNNLWYDPITYAVYDDLQTGKQVYVNDPSTTFSNIGPYAGMSFIQTSGGADHKNEPTNPFLTFNIDTDATIYVAMHADNASTEPFNSDYWLAPQYGWTFTGNTIEAEVKDAEGNVTDTNIYRVYSRTYKAGTVALGGNQATGHIGFGRMYAVLVGPAVGTPLDPPPPPPSVVPGTIPAFPGAEGGGKFATGGRGKDVYYVTNLNDSGPGSFRDAVSQSNRTILFKVSGTIELQSMLYVASSNLTIAGQSAPGDGITFKNYTVVFQGDNLIVRYLRFRTGDEAGLDMDGTTGRHRQQLIFDHISASWGTDESFSFYQNVDFTLQYSTIGPTIVKSNVPGKGFHGYGGIWGGENATFYYNLLAHNDSRNPRFSGKSMDVRNNVIYDWGYKSMYGQNAQGNLVNNYYKAGISTLIEARMAETDVVDASPPYSSSIALTGNKSVRRDGSLSASSHPNNFSGIYKNPQMFVSTPFAMPNPSPQDSPDVAYEKVLNYAGASLKRDAVDHDLVNDVINGTGSVIYTANNVTAEEQATLDGKRATKVTLQWPALQTAEVPADTDGDGMPDVWELEHGLNPNDALDGKTDFTGDGYTNLEKYLNELTRGTFPEGVVPSVPKAVVNGAPGDVRALALNRDSIRLDWTPVAGATGYHVYRAASANGAYTKLTTTALTAPLFVNNGLTAGTEYAYKVTAVTSNGESALSLHAAATTKAPLQPIAVDFNDGTNGAPYFAPADWPAAWLVSSTPSSADKSLSVPPNAIGTFTYDFTAAGTTSHLRFDYMREANFDLDKLLFYTGSNFLETVADSVYGLRYRLGTTNEYRNLIPGFQLNNWYTVAIDLDFAANTVTFRTGPKNGPLTVQAQESYTGASPKISALRIYNQRSSGNVYFDNLTAWNGPAEPSGVTATARRNEVALSWNSVSGADSYAIYRAESLGGPYRKLEVGAITGNSYRNKGLVSDTTYYYKISAINAEGESPLSAPLQVTVGGPSSDLLVDFNDGTVGEPYSAYPTAWPAAWLVAVVPSSANRSLSVPNGAASNFVYDFIDEGPTAQFSFDYMREANFNGDKILLYTGSNFLEIQTDTANGLKYRLGTSSTYRNLLPGFQLNTWYRVTVELDFTTNTVTFRTGPQNGTLTQQAQETYTAASPKISAFRVYSQRAAGNVYFDNFNVSKD
ncbi:Fibronectin type III domain-containing protein [Paenibacillus sp. UNCCL117]|uniref:fibronectin type III domain-containing protein n=1 Tax=unclassified Paenibacillus TaxID=185978 RepID=UPI0008879684|nr:MULTISPECIES: fibronectin type III domain-containing protein [unclassified Paenibacillus]SDD14546.1 Fibronectin type III domain-containing protein [Paenibacillus sp. cl123]SFW34246.1 Fibronectin type III domain-containing protein [Paenibacillus sp. UNCCL117]